MLPKKIGINISVFIAWLQNRKKSILTTILSALLLSIMMFSLHLSYSLSTGNTVVLREGSNYFLIFLVSIFLVTSTQKILSLSLLTFLFVLQFSYFLFQDYFGAILAPDHLRMGGREISIVIDTFIGSLSLFQTTLIIGSISLAISLMVVHFSAPRVIKWPVSSILLVALLLFVPIRLWAKDRIVIPPTVERQHSILSVLNTLSSYAYNTVMDEYFPGNFPKTPSISLKIGSTEKNEKPLVAFILGESTRASNMGIFGYRRNTTPGLAEMLQSPGEFKLFARPGFSYATSSLTTLAQIYNISAGPFDTGSIKHKKNNLFKMAKQQGFRTNFISSQVYKSLRDADTTRIDNIVIRSDMGEEFDKIQSDAIFSHLPAIDDSIKEFLFVYQWVNHDPFMKHCAHKPENIHIYPTSNLDKNLVRINSYDNGMRCYDDNLVAIFNRLAIASKRPVYIFVTGDHGYLLGEDGMWGHGHLHPENMVVPFMLYTNRPQSEIARRFNEMRTLTHFSLVKLASLALGYEVIEHHDTKNKIFGGYLWNGKSKKYLELTATPDPLQFNAVKRTSTGKALAHSKIRLPGK